MRDNLQDIHIQNEFAEKKKFILYRPYLFSKLSENII